MPPIMVTTPTHATSTPATTHSRLRTFGPAMNGRTASETGGEHYGHGLQSRQTEEYGRQDDRHAPEGQRMVDLTAIPSGL